MTVMQFWQEIGVSAAVSARAEEVLREKKTLLSGLPLERWRTAPYEEGLSALREALGPESPFADRFESPDPTVME